MRFICKFSILFILLYTPGVVSAQENLNLYFGLLHAHTWYSDGSGTPEEAYRMAKDQGLNFFAVTPHNHSKAEGKGAPSFPSRKDQVLIAINPELYNSSSPVTFTRRWKEGEIESHSNEKSVIQAAKDITSTNFLAIYGQEYSTISGGNHINVFGTNSLITVRNGRFDDLIEEMENRKNSGENLILQLNHPDAIGDLTESEHHKAKNDYGLDDFGGDFKTLVVNADHYYNLIEVFSGPALDEGIYSETYRYADYRYEFNDYYFYLKQGFHLSPSVGQDNHFKTWGKATPARMGVYAKSLSMEDIFDALRNHRTYATEDKNVELQFLINGNMMGSKLSMNSDKDLEIKVIIDDPDNLDDFRSAELFHGTIFPETANQWSNVRYFDKRVEYTKKKTGNTVTFNVQTVSGDPEFYFVKITQSDGQRVISAPIWINYDNAHFGRLSTNAEFYWTASANSRIYHKAGCNIIKSIAERNLRSGNTPPSNRSIHRCTFSNFDEEH